MARRFGLGIDYAAGIAPLSQGVIPTPAWKRAKLGRPWYGGETLIAGIGQGFVLTTPLQLAVMTARIASGRLVLPSLVRPGPGFPARRFADIGLSSRHLNAVRRAMWAVVNEGGGTGAWASLGEGAPDLAGKTGTAQVSRRSVGRPVRSLRWGLRDHALFVGYAPAGNPRYAVAAIIEHGGGGGTTAAPLVADIMKDVLARDPIARPGFDPIRTPARGIGQPFASDSARG